MAGPGNSKIRMRLFMLMLYIDIMVFVNISQCEIWYFGLDVWIKMLHIVFIDKLI